MKNDGWVKIHRKLRDNPIYSNSVAVHCWIECLLRASHEDEGFFLSRRKVILKPGEFIMGREEFGKKIGVSGSTAWYWLNQFKVDSMIDIKTTNKGSVVSIKKWNTYQKADNKLDNRKTTDEQQMNTDKNVKNVKKRDGTRTTPVFNEEYAIKLAGELLVPLSEIKRVWDMMVASRISQGKPYKEWNMALRNWVLRRIDEGKLQPNTGDIIYKSQL